MTDHTDAPTDPRRDAESIARRFHEAYERLAPEFGYETRKASAVPWESVPENNRRLMIAVAGEVLEALSGATERRAAFMQGHCPDHGEQEFKWIEGAFRCQVCGGEPAPLSFEKPIAGATDQQGEDTRRLDWLCESDHTEEIGYDARGAKWLPMPGVLALRTDLRTQPGFVEFDEDGWPVFSSVRAAIDAAMQPPAGGAR